MRIFSSFCCNLFYRLIGIGSSIRFIFFTLYSRKLEMIKEGQEKMRYYCSKKDSSELGIVLGLRVM